jgi:hypothetical protein
MKRLLLHYSPLLIALGVLWLLVGLFLSLSLQKNDGNLVYALDDPYIHLAIVKNFVRYGVWGVTPYEWSSSSSSLLWSLLLSLAFTLFGVRDVIPLILNLLAASLLLILIDSLLNKVHGTVSAARTLQIELIEAHDLTKPAKSFHLTSSLPWDQLYRFLVLLAFIFLTPLPTLIFTGMEHTFQALINLLFFYLTIQSVAEKSPAQLGTSQALLLLAPLLTLVRYEGIFLVFGCILLLLSRRHLRQAILVALLALLPLIIYGMISLSHGWYALPNSVLLKSQAVNSPLALLKVLSGYRLLQNIYVSQSLTLFGFFLLLLMSLALSVARYYSMRKFWEREQLSLILFLIVMWCHLLFARVGGFFRYEAYLVVLGLYVVALMGQKAIASSLRTNFMQDSAFSLTLYRVSLPKYSIMSGLALFAFVVLGVRGAKGMKDLVQGTTNIYEQQYQMGLFLQTFYEGQSVAANDIGAINYLAEIRCLDLVGLGSLDVARHYRNQSYTTAAIKEMTEAYGTRVAIVYDRWFQFVRTGQSILPDDWVKVGEWTISNNVVAAAPTVSIYAVHPDEVRRLADNLRQFAPRLPKTVKQSGQYMDMKTEIEEQ